MEVIFVLLPVALIFCAAAVAVFVWAARTGQFDDLTTPGLRVLHDDEPACPSGPDAAPSPDEGAGEPAGRGPG